MKKIVILSLALLLLFGASGVVTVAGQKEVEIDPKPFAEGQLEGSEMTPVNNEQVKVTIDPIHVI